MGNLPTYAEVSTAFNNLQSTLDRIINDDWADAEHAISKADWWEDCPDKDRFREDCERIEADAREELRRIYAVIDTKLRPADGLPEDLVELKFDAWDKIGKQANEMIGLIAKRAKADSWEGEVAQRYHGGLATQMNALREFQGLASANKNAVYQVGTTIAGVFGSAKASLDSMASQIGEKIDPQQQTRVDWWYGENDEVGYSYVVFTATERARQILGQGAQWFENITNELSADWNGSMNALSGDLDSSRHAGVVTDKFGTWPAATTHVDAEAGETNLVDERSLDVDSASTGAEGKGVHMRGFGH